MADKSPVPAGSRPPLEATVSFDSTRGTSEVPSKIGPYQILELLGEGGMGVVYLADQKEPVRRRVALKLIKLGMDTKEVVARFESERQALALMNHANVARVFDAGTTEYGRPYFVMEYVPGVPITSYCDMHRLDVSSRLELFVQVCEAVQHAHQKGIIHRDLKPSNVLVMVQDDRAVPKVIDFGVAKATNQRLTEKTLFTEQGRLVGTPAYMSPEQAEMTALDVDTRTDVYSLGVLLYELLVGALPFDPASLRSAGYAELQRIIREVEPKRPSTRFSSLGAHSTEISQRRHLAPRVLERLLRGDLDSITMKAMEKDRTRRYATASELALDIARHLNQEPVIACPPSLGYRFGKFIKKHKAGVAAASAVFISLSAGLLATSILYFEAASAKQAEAEQRHEAEQQRDEADFARKAETAQYEVAEKHRKELEAVNQFLINDMLAAANPQRAKGRDVTVMEVLDRAAEKVGSAFANEPEIEAAIRNTIAVTYESLGAFDAAEPHFVTAYEIRRTRLGDDAPATLFSLSHLAMLRASQDRLEEAETLCRQAVETGRRVLGQNYHDTLSFVNNLAIVLERMGKLDEAESLYRSVFETRQRTLGEAHLETIGSMNNLALFLGEHNKSTEAEDLARKALEFYKRTLGDEHPYTLTCMNNLALLMNRRGNVADAESLYRRGLEIGHRILPDGHPDVLTSMTNLAELLRGRGELVEAEALAREARDESQRRLGDEHRITLHAMNALADVLLRQERFSEAELLYSKILEFQRSKLGEEHPDTLIALNDMAVLLRNEGRLDEAEPLSRLAVYRSRRIFGDESPKTLAAMKNLALLLKRQGNLDEAESLYRQTLQTELRVHGQEHPNTLRTMNNLVTLLVTRENFAEAEPLARKTLEMRQRLLGDDHVDTISSMNNLASLLRTQAKLEEAESLYRKALELARHRLGAQDQDTMRLANGLAGVLESKRDFDGAEKLRLDLFAFSQNGKARDRQTEPIQRLIDLYQAWNRPDKVAEWRAKLDVGPLKP